MAKYDAIKKILYNFCKKNPNLKKNQVVDHFEKLGFKQRSIYRWLELIYEKKSLKRKVGSGRPAKIATKTNIEIIKKKMTKTFGISQRPVAKEMKCHQSYICKILKKKTNVVCYKKIKKPKMTASQKILAVPKCRKMYEKFKNLDFVMDDESYFTLNNSINSFNKHFYSSNRKKTHESLKYNYQKKFDEKLLVWICMSPKGVGIPLIKKAGMAINKQTYLDECIKQRLLPFLKKNHPHGHYVFWPDLASAHYAKDVQKFLKEKNIRYVPRSINPANVPKARPIEDFWANLKRKVYQGVTQFQNLEELKDKIISCLKNIDLKSVQAHMRATSKRLINVWKNRE